MFHFLLNNFCHAISIDKKVAKVVISTEPGGTFESLGSFHPAEISPNRKRIEFSRIVTLFNSQFHQK